MVLYKSATGENPVVLIRMKYADFHMGGMVEWSTSKRLIHAVASSIPDERFLPEVSIPPAQW